MYDRDRLEEWPAPFMPTTAYRALHSLYVDALFEATTDLRTAILKAANGMSFGHFILAIHGRQYRVEVRIDQDVPWLWLSYWTGDGYRPIVAVTSDVLGVDHAVLLREQQMRLEDAMTDILGAPW